METTKEGLLTTQTVDDVVILGFNRGRIRDEREILKTLESLGRYIESKPGLKVVVDLGNVEYLSSAGLGHLVGLLKRAKGTGSVLKLCSLRESIQELFEVMRLTRIFDIYSAAKEAVEAFKSVAKGAVAAGSPCSCAVEEKK